MGLANDILSLYFIALRIKRDLPGNKNNVSYHSNWRVRANCSRKIFREQPNN
jgi:hypothetical protein